MGKVFSYKNSLNLIASRSFKELKKLTDTVTLSMTLGKLSPLLLSAVEVPSVALLLLSLF